MNWLSPWCRSSASGSVRRINHDYHRRGAVAYLAA